MGSHVQSIISRAGARVRALRALCAQKWGPSCGAVRILYLSYVESLIKFGIGVWHPLAPKRLLRELNGVITECSRTITGLPARADRRVALHKADTLSLDELFTLGGVAIVERASRALRDAPSRACSTLPTTAGGWTN